MVFIRDQHSDLQAEVDDMNYVLGRFDRVLAQLGNGFPRFLKGVLHSDVAGGMAALYSRILL